MNGLAVIVGVALFWLGYAFAAHDARRHDWQITWITGQNRRHAARLRQLEAAVGLTPPDDEAQLPAEPSRRARAAARLRAVRTWLDEHLQPTPADPDPQPEPPTEPIAQVAVDPWRARFTFDESRQP